MQPQLPTPAPEKSPRINSPSRFGVRPGAPFLYRIAVSGLRPVVFSVEGLPAGLSLDREKGIISGSLSEAGEFVLTLMAKNSAGEARKNLTVSVGERIALTPPMGWNSWYCLSESVGEEQIRRQARAMQESGLADFGWTYICIDDCWQGRRGGPLNAIQPNERFGDMKAMADEIHGLGLKLGIYSTPWIGTYAGFSGGSSDNANGEPDEVALPPEQRLQDSQVYGRYPGLHECKVDRVGRYWFMDRDAKQWAEWGVDFVKADWLLADVSPLAPVYQALRDAGRDMVLSLSNSGRLPLVAEYQRYAQMWRTTGDIQDTWESISGIGFAQAEWQQHLSAGGWPDPDMLQVGHIGKTNAENREFVPTRLTPDEQYTQMTLWCLLSAPLILSCDLTQLDDFTRGLLTNAEVLEIDQDIAAQPCRLLQRDEEHSTEVWVKSLADGSYAVALFNRGDKDEKISADLNRLSGKGICRLRDLWRQQDLPLMTNLQQTVSPHGTFLCRVWL
ncbi:MAG: putative Ig domain-containing protein [Verrucomicrobiales bacterium]|jgi:alpha-galactosidase|nr:putative Ig domain-containing protein [Verrucomicrobiales bacterium]